MKKVLMATLLVAIFGGMAMAQTDQIATVDVSVNVKGVWELMLDNSAVAFGDMDAGDNASAAITAYVRTNQKVSWDLQLAKNWDLTNASVTPNETIPSTNFTYTGSGGLASDWIVEGQFPSTTTTVYTADADEYKSLGAGTALTTTYDLTIPFDAAAGTYTNTITYTLTTTP